MLKKLWRMGWLCLGILGFVACTTPVTQTRALELGRVVVQERGAAKVHTYIAPAVKGNNTTHIIETESGLVVIDGQFTASCGQEASRYVQSLKKPVLRFFVSHQHPDHWLGLAEFGNVPSAALPEVRQVVNGEVGNRIFENVSKRLGADAPRTKAKIQDTIEPGEISIGGLRYQVERITDAEADAQMVLNIPEIKTMVVQDLAYAQSHHVIGSLKNKDAFSGWIRALNGLNQRVTEETLVLVGHGYATSPIVLTQSIQYLENARNIRKNAPDAATFEKEIKNQFPDYTGDGFIMLTTKNLYP